MWMRKERSEWCGWGWWRHRNGKERERMGKVGGGMARHGGLLVVGRDDATLLMLDVGGCYYW